MLAKACAILDKWYNWPSMTFCRELGLKKRGVQRSRELGEKYEPVTSFVPQKCFDLILRVCCVSARSQTLQRPK